MEYQKLTKNKRKTYNQQAKEQLINDSKDSKTFWSTIRKLNGRKHKIPNIPITTWFEHYDELLSLGYTYPPLKHHAQWKVLLY